MNVNLDTLPRDRFSVRASGHPTLPDRVRTHHDASVARLMTRWDVSGLGYGTSMVVHEPLTGVPTIVHTETPEKQ